MTEDGVLPMLAGLTSTEDPRLRINLCNAITTCCKTGLATFSPFHTPFAHAPAHFSLLFACTLNSRPFFLSASTHKHPRRRACRPTVRVVSFAPPLSSPSSSSVQS